MNEETLDQLVAEIHTDFHTAMDIIEERAHKQINMLEGRMWPILNRVEASFAAISVPPLRPGPTYE